MATPLEQLEAMRKMPENWDGYGGAAPREDVIDAAIRFLSQILGTGGVPEPFVSPTRIGGVLIEWELGAHELEVEFSSLDRASFLYMNTETGKTVTV
jgi:hypothetical protein